MDQSEFRDLLTVAQEFKVAYFKKGDIEVQFQMDYSKTPAADLFGDLKDKPDPDEEYLKKIEELKAQALGNTI